MTIETARMLADELVENWTEGTDLDEHIPDWALKDLRELIANKILLVAP